MVLLLASHLCCCSALYMKTHTKISSRQIAWQKSQAYETQALHVWGGQCEMIVEFICTAIHFSAEADLYKYRLNGFTERNTDLCRHIKTFERIQSDISKMVKVSRDAQNNTRFLLRRLCFCTILCWSKKTQAVLPSPTYLFWHNTVLFSARPDLSLLLLLRCNIYVLILAGLGRSLNVSQLVLWGKAERLHSIWLLPRPQIILMGTGVDKEPGAKSCKT